MQGGANARTAQTGAHEKPDFGFAGWNTAALQVVILNEHPFPANCQLLIARCLFSKSFLATSHPEALLEYSCFIRPKQ